MNRKNLFINIFANVISFIVDIGISIFLTRFIVQTLGKEAYGFIGLSSNIVSYITIITLALNAMASRFISIKLFEDDHIGAQVYFSSVFISNIILSAILVMPMAFVALFVEKILNVPFSLLSDVRMLWVLVCVEFIVSMCTNIFSIAIFIKNKLYLNSLRSIATQIIKSVLLLICFIFFPAHVWYIALANIVATFFITLFNVRCSRRFLPSLSIQRKNFRFKAVKELLASGMWTSLNKFNTVLLEGMDLLLANLFISESAMGLLAITKTVPGYFHRLFYMFAPTFEPKMFMLYAEKKKAELIEYINRCNKLLIFFISIPIAGFIVFCDTFFHLWLPSENTVILRQLSILSLVGVYSTTYSGVLYSVFIMTNKLKLVSLAVLITSILSITIVFISLKTTNYGIYAIAGVSSLLLMVNNFSFMTIYAARCLNAKWHTFYGNILQGTVSLFVILVMAIIIKNIWKIQTWGVFMLEAALTAIFGFFINCFILLNANERRDMCLTIAKKIKSVLIYKIVKGM